MIQMIPPKSKEQIDIEKILQQLRITERYVKELENRVNFLERENSRRKSEMNQLASAIGRS
jgi:hypothetical protein